MTYGKVVTCLVAWIAASLVVASTASAQYVFTNWDGDNFWNNPGNWNQPTPPPTGEVAWINHTPDEALINELVFGDPAELVIGQGAGDGAVRVTEGGDIQTGHINLAWGTGGDPRNGSYAQDGGLALVTGEVRAGRDVGGGVATIDISGGTLQVGGNFFLGDGNQDNIMTMTGGTVTIGGSLRLSDRGDAGTLPLSTAPSMLELTGGSLSIGGLLAIGARTVNDVTGEGKGHFLIGGDAELNIAANVAMRVGAGNSFTVEGSGATINVNRPAATGFEVHQENDVNFIFDESGISPVTITALMRWSHEDSTLNVDASAFSGLGTFDLFTFAGYFDVPGVPKEFGTHNLTFAPGRGGSISYNDTSITLTIEESDGVAGDFNMDGVVDAADYVVWRSMGGSTAQYNEWRSNFGAGTMGGGSGELAAVPEPASLLLLLSAGGVALAARRRCRVR